MQGVAQKARRKQNLDDVQDFFATEYHDLREQQKLNSTQVGFHSANAAMEQVQIVSALDNLALAATTDRDIVAKLTAITTELAATNKSLTEQIKQLLATNAALVGRASTGTPATPATNTDGDTAAKRIARLANLEAKRDPNGYCWTHGYRVVRGHTSKSCTSRANGHQEAATRQDTMSGCMTWKPAE